ncbi:MAG: hypothetical protein EWV60_05200 [Microcystis sp. Msp_OC_L_20101000_S702]|uniref:hypothetical protein n=1 Tax=Microcystis sp. Msp_OC_L_20101000_S702 TaxID=2486218 RepID=UPI00119207DD|nr:hypothetical protein [Microcystis sp. Msp_OC_L_20101000_S702]TRU12750.1 MAG: hypothetical protein EWV60_05200 [Microcystis sp. Msp_OC_L_20101000_S702]
MTTLLVPVYLDALYLPTKTNVLEEMTDYSKLPYYKNSQLVNRGSAYISETVLTVPFTQPQLSLKAGIHLHWSLPDALTNGIARDGEQGITFPLVPNRWLIIRRGSNIAEKKWVVESDYLYPEGATPEDTINILYYPATNEYQPYRFLGRKLELGAWRSGTANAQYIQELSAIGPFATVDNLDNEKVAFAGFYPNCRSVFGFHDGDFTTNTTPPKDLRYDVIGWYSDGKNDYLDKFIKEQYPDRDPLSLLDTLQSKAGWTVEIGNNQSFPDRLLCHASLSFAPGASVTNPQAIKGTIAVGNNQEEAIAAYVARQLDTTNTENRKTIEEQLEAIQMSGRLVQQNLDFGPKFRQGLHEDSFTGQCKEISWQVVPESDPKISQSGSANPANAVQGEGIMQVTLSATIGDRISEVNEAQREYDQQLAKVGSIREQVYADWYKYMLATYVLVNPDERLLDRSKIQTLGTSAVNFINKTSDSNLVQTFLKDTADNNQYGVKALENAIKAAGVLKVLKNEQDQNQIVSASVSNNLPGFPNYPFDSNSKASQLARSINTLIAEVQKFNKESRLIAPKKSVQVTGDSTLVDDDIAMKCLSFDGNQNYEISNLGNIQSLSMWVNIPEGVQGSLLEVRSTSLYVNSTNGISSTWQKIYINGQQVNGPINWTAIPKNRWVFLHLEANNPFSGTVYLMSNSSGSHRLRGRIASVSFHKKPLSPTEIERDYQDKIGLFRPSYTIKIVPGPRYWQPSDPVVLMTGEVAKPTRNRDDERLRTDGLLQCKLLTQSIDLQSLPDNTLNIFVQFLSEFGNNPTEKIGFRQWANQPWNPFLLEWQVQLKGLEHKSQQSKNDKNKHTPSVNYDTNIFKDKYQLRVDGLEITPTDASANHFADYPNLYRGASFLSSSASMLLKDNLIDYLTKYLLPDYYQEQNISPDDQTEDYLVKNFNAVKGWYDKKNPTASDPFSTALRAYQQLQSLNGCLAQSLGGFSDALLTYNRTIQLDVNDNLLAANGPAKDFLKNVQNTLELSSRLVPDSILRSPLTGFDFSPIRVGGLKITDLRLVDTFGQVNVVLDTNNSREIVTSQPLTLPSAFANVLSSHPIYLPPRLAQPARLNFRWLSATRPQGTRRSKSSKQDQEMNETLATKPICGWVLPNNLDNSLTIYDDEGNALVMIDRTAQLRSIPGHDYREKQIQEIIDRTNPYLKQMVRYLIDQGAAFMSDFLTTVNAALQTIDPEGFAQNKAISLLVSRPLALVRSRINLDIQGIPAVSQNRISFSNDLFYNKFRTTQAFEKVKFPIRIGEYQQFNDSLVGYWVEKADGTYTDSVFYAPQSCYVPHEKIKTLFENEEDPTPDTPLNLEQTLEENTAQTLVMLIDPRGQVNATCGILPAKSISIPPEQYLPALQAIEVTFLAAPLLSDLNPINDLDQIKLSLPEVPNYEWSWLGKDGTVWSNRPLVPFDSQSVYSSPQKIYDGWLKLTRKTETNE